MKHLNNYISEALVKKHYNDHKDDIDVAHVYYSFSSAEELNTIGEIGQFIYQTPDNIVVTNSKVDKIDYTLIGLCCGEGPNGEKLWVDFQWEGLTKTLEFAGQGSDLYNFYINNNIQNYPLTDDGLQNTIQWLKVSSNADKVPYILSQRNKKLQYDAFIPSAEQLKTVLDTIMTTNNEDFDFIKRLIVAKVILSSNLDLHHSSVQNALYIKTLYPTKDGGNYYVSRISSKQYSMALMHFGKKIL